MKPYVCDGATVRMNNGREGKVLGVDRQNKIVAVHTGSSTVATRLDNVVVISYKGVK